jgi:pantoate--beta-alanine ligase
MQTIEKIEAWRKSLDAERFAGRRVGLVPTMGSLHAGHASLIRRAAEECDVVGVTVFVNPLQFGPAEDLAAYPRDLDADQHLAEQCGAAYLFAPSVAEMYPTPIGTTVAVPGLSARFEGASRPGHFDGVATVVAKLFAQAGACRAYFGQKDFQQLAVIRRMVADLSIPVEVVGCETVREPDGLALSSRNVYLSPAERAAAPTLYRALRRAAELIEQAARPNPGGQLAPLTAADVRRVMGEIVASEQLLSLDYAEVVEAATLTAPELLVGEIRLLIAARLGRTRLIDNLGVNI